MAYALYRDGRCTGDVQPTREAVLLDAAVLGVVASGPASCASFDPGCEHHGTRLEDGYEIREI